MANGIGERVQAFMEENRELLQQDCGFEEGMAVFKVEFPGWPASTPLAFRLMVRTEDQAAAVERLIVPRFRETFDTNEVTLSPKLWADVS